jgi:hypothetical protein
VKTEPVLKKIIRERSSTCFDQGRDKAVAKLNKFTTMLWRRMGSSQLHASAILPLGKEFPVPIGEEVSWTPGPVWTIWRSENFLPYWDSNSDHSVVKPVVSCYTDCAKVLALEIYIYCILASCYISFTLNICSFVHQCPSMTYNKHYKT